MTEERGCAQGRGVPGAAAHSTSRTRCLPTLPGTPGTPAPETPNHLRPRDTCVALRGRRMTVMAVSVGTEVGTRGDACGDVAETRRGTHELRGRGRGGDMGTQAARALWRDPPQHTPLQTPQAVVSELPKATPRDRHGPRPLWRTARAQGRVLDAGARASQLSQAMSTDAPATYRRKADASAVQGGRAGPRRATGLFVAERRGFGGPSHPDSAA